MLGTADLVALSPDGSKAIVQWGPSCGQLVQKPVGQVALRDLATSTDVVLPGLSASDHINVAWSPDGTRVATEVVGSHHVVVFDDQGHQFSQFARPASSQDGIGWTADGLVLVDLGNDKTAVVRTYDASSGQAISELARIPQVYANGQSGALRDATRRFGAHCRGLDLCRVGERHRCADVRADLDDRGRQIGDRP